MFNCHDFIDRFIRDMNIAPTGEFSAARCRCDLKIAKVLRFKCVVVILLPALFAM